MAILLTGWEGALQGVTKQRTIAMNTGTIWGGQGDDTIMMLGACSVFGNARNDTISIHNTSDCATVSGDNDAPLYGAHIYEVPSKLID